MNRKQTRREREKLEIDESHWEGNGREGAIIFPTELNVRVRPLSSSLMKRLTCATDSQEAQVRPPFIVSDLSVWIDWRNGAGK